MPGGSTLVFKILVLYQYQPMVCGINIVNIGYEYELIFIWLAW